MIRFRQLRAISAITGLIRHGRCLHLKVGNAIAYRVDAPAAGTLHGAFIGRESEALAALRNRTSQTVEELFEHHGIWYTESGWDCRVRRMIEATQPERSATSLWEKAFVLL